MFKHPLTLTLLLFLAQLGLFLWITLRPFTISPPNRTYYILRGQGAYTALIRQAQDGAWKVYNPYTTRPTPAIYMHLFYVFLGKTAAIFSIDPVYAYMITRIVAGLILFIVTYWFIGSIVPKKLLSITLLFALGLEPGPLISSIHNLPSLAQSVPAIFSYYPQQAALRHFGLPHHVLAEALGLLLLGTVFLIVKKWSWQRLVLLGLITIAGTFMMPAYNSVLILTVFAAWGIWALFRGDVKKMFTPFTLIILTMVIVAIFTKNQMDAGYPAKNFNLDEKRWVTDGELLINYVSSLILYLPATLFLWISLPRIWRHMDALAKLLVVLATSWVVGPILYIPLTHFSFFPFANFRLIDGYAYIPMGILSAMGLYWLAIITKKRWIMGVCVGLVFAASLLLTVSYTRQLFTEQHKIWDNVYPLNDEWRAIRFLSTIPKRSGVLVTKHFGEIIPSYANVRVYLGETPGFVDWEERNIEATSFYSGTLSDTDAKMMLTREDISYVWWGFLEKRLLKTGGLYPNILTPVFHTPEITVFEVKK